MTISTNGSRQNKVSYRLDGGNNVDEYTNVNAPFPFPDALQEFSVQTSNYSAEYGQNSGAVVNIITKSGTNNLHGNAFGFCETPFSTPAISSPLSTFSQNGVLTPTKDKRARSNQAQPVWRHFRRTHHPQPHVFLLRSPVHPLPQCGKPLELDRTHHGLEHDPCIRAG